MALSRAYTTPSPRSRRAIAAPGRPAKPAPPKRRARRAAKRASASRATSGDETSARGTSVGGTSRRRSSQCKTSERRPAPRAIAGRMTPQSGATSMQAVASPMTTSTSARSSANPSKPRSRPTPIQKQALWTGGAIATLAALVIVPTRVASQAMIQSNCEQVIQSGAEISRGQISQLLEIPTGSPQVAVQQVISEPYCTLPSTTTNEASGNKASGNKASGNEASGAESSQAKLKDGQPAPEIVTERHAYPLAFDPEAWVVVRYQAGVYAGYDFVFKP